jgi:LmbE family N-acetylglucosaminyl deacetylase
VQLGYADSGFPALGRPESFSCAPLEECAAAISRVLREEPPSVVITHDADGGYGHADHVRAHEATVLARAMACPQAALYAVVFPQAVLSEFVEAMAAAGVSAPRQGLMGIEDDIDASFELGVPDELASDSLDVSAYVETKRLAVAAHRSQMGDDHVLMRMPDEVRRAVWQREYFRRLV